MNELSDLKDSAEKQPEATRIMVDRDASMQIIPEDSREEGATTIDYGEDSERQSNVVGKDILPGLGLDADSPRSSQVSNLVKYFDKGPNASMLS